MRSLIQEIPRQRKPKHVFSQARLRVLSGKNFIFKERAIHANATPSTESPCVQKLLVCTNEGTNMRPFRGTNDCSSSEKRLWKGHSSIRLPNRGHVQRAKIGFWQKGQGLYACMLSTLYLPETSCNVPSRPKLQERHGATCPQRAATCQGTSIGSNSKAATFPSLSIQSLSNLSDRGGTWVAFFAECQRENHLASTHEDAQHQPRCPGPLQLIAKPSYLVIHLLNCRIIRMQGSRAQLCQRPTIPQAWIPSGRREESTNTSRL